MKYLEDTLAEQCLSKTLYPNTKIYVRRKKVEGTLMTYTNELEVEVDFSDVDPNLLKASKDDEEQSLVTVTNSNVEEDSKSLKDDESTNTNEPNLGLGNDEQKQTIAKRAAKFFKNKKKD